jgi:YfiR/HmsC-like
MVWQGRFIGMKAFIRSRARVIPILLWASSAGFLWPQSLGIDTVSQYRIYLKVLSFDREFKARAGDRLVIGILYAKASRDSRQAKENFARAVAAGPADFEGLPVSTVPIEHGREDAIEAALAAGAVNVLYVTPLMPYDVAPVSAACRARHVPSFTGVPEYVRSGLSVSFGMKGSGAEIFINLRNSRAEGSDFSSRLLDMVTVVDGRPKEEPHESP